LLLRLQLLLLPLQLPPLPSTIIDPGKCLAQYHNRGSFARFPLSEALETMNLERLQEPGIGSRNCQILLLRLQLLLLPLQLPPLPSTIIVDGSGGSWSGSKSSCRRNNKIWQFLLPIPGSIIRSQKCSSATENTTGDEPPPQEENDSGDQKNNTSDDAQSIMVDGSGGSWSGSKSSCRRNNKIWQFLLPIPSVAPLQRIQQGTSHLLRRKTTLATRKITPQMMRVVVQFPAHSHHLRCYFSGRQSRFPPEEVARPLLYSL
jgi:hypothetical protein